MIFLHYPQAITHFITIFFAILGMMAIFTIFVAMDGGSKKILLLGDYSNCHSALATGLRRLGHDVTVASNGTRWMDTERDIDLTRPLKGKAGGLALWAKLLGSFGRRFEGYDIVSINNPVFIDLKPGRVKWLFNRLKARNGAVFLTSMGNDVNYIRMCLDPHGPLAYSEWRIGAEAGPLVKATPGVVESWLNPSLIDLTDHIFANIDGATSVLYEYDLSLRRTLGDEKTAYTGIPIDTSAMRPVELPDRIERVKFFLGRHAGRQAEKGTDLLEAAAREVVSRHPAHAEMVIVENKPYTEYLQLLRSAHIVLDQIYSYTPATNALLAMAYGLNAVSGGEPEFYRFIGETDNHPVINAPHNYDALVATLESIVRNRNQIAERGRRSREFVVKHNNDEIVARRALDFWNSRIDLKRHADS